MTAPTRRPGHTTVGILEMCELTDDLSAVHGPYLQLFEMMFSQHDVGLLSVAVHAGKAPDSLDDADVWIATGSPVSVYDDLPWIATAETLVREAAAAEIPFVGICFGHQLVAQALGGRVAKATVGWGVGALEYTTASRPPMLASVPDTLTILASHQDQVVEVPGAATVWSTSDYCPNAGMAVGDRMWTVQGHPEFTSELVRSLYGSRRDRIGEDPVDVALATLARPLSNQLIADAIVATADAGRVKPRARRRG